MESGVEDRNVQEESAMQRAQYLKRGGFATTSGQDYEVVLCCLFFLRALRLTSGDFFLASNHDLAGIFDDVVLFYRLQGDRGPEYRAILLQAKHKDTITNKKLTMSNPFTLKAYLDSFKEIRHHWEQPLKVGNTEIQFQEIILVLYTNTGCVIGDAAFHVPEFEEVQHLQNFLNTGGRLLKKIQVKGDQRAGLPQGQETADFLDHLILCTEQINVIDVNSFLEEELRNMFKLKSTDFARELNYKFRELVKAWWSEIGVVNYLTPESKEWKTIIEMAITRLNEDTLNIHRQLNLEFMAEDIGVVPPRLELIWISVRDEYQAMTVRLRLFRAQRNFLVVSVKCLDDHLEEVEALWRNDICSTLVLDMYKVTTEEESPLLQRLQEALQSGAGRRLVIIAKGKPTSAGWSEVDTLPTWSVLQQVTRDRLLAAPVRLQGEAVALRDVIGSHVSNVMTDEVISSLCERETEMQLGGSMPAPLNYYVQRCLQRTSSAAVNADTLISTNTLIFSSNSFSRKNKFTKRFHVIRDYEAHRITHIEYPTIVTGMRNEYDMRQLCCRFRVQGMFGEISMNGLEGDIKQFLPFPWIREDKIVVIEGPPGVGKSSFVTVMCSTVKEQFPQAWVLRLDMGRHTEYIKDTDFTEVIHIKELLLKCLHKNPNNVERQFLEHSLTVTGNVFLFLDAFDEISPDYTRKCCDLLKGIVQTIRYRQMVVTTRPVTTKDVEEALQEKAFTLPVFSEEEKDLFLKQFSAARGISIGEKETSSLRESAGPVLEIPLLCKMAAEVLDSQGQLFFKSLNPWRRVLLYKLFVEQSIKQRVAEKFGLDISIPGIKMLLESNQKVHLQNLQGLAVRKLMPVDQLPPLSVSTEMPEEKLGLVVNTGDRVDFEHQTFAEYFVGCWLACHWQQCSRELLRRDGFQFATFHSLLFDGFPLHMAVAQGNDGAVSKHLSSSVTVDTGRRSALHVAAMTQGNHREVWELLVTSGEDLNRKDDVLGATAVEYAEIFSNWEFVDFGVEKGANIADLKFVTVQEAAKEVLIHAVENDLVCLCEFICRQHSDVLPNLHPLHLAAANNSKHVMKLLIDMLHEINEVNKRRDTPLQEASRRGHVDAVTLLVERGADVNVQVKYGYTALMEAALRGYLEVVKILAENGADVNIKTTRGLTALTLACRGGHLEIVRILLNKGADLNIKSKDGYTALTRAAWNGHLDVVKVLVENGAHINLKTEHGYTGLTFAASEGYLDVVKLLLENGADINIKTEDGDMALTLASREGHREVVKVLLENGADVNIKTERGLTALILASREGHRDVVKVLLENGADVNIKTEDGDTALTMATREGHLEVLKVLEKEFDVNTERI